MPVTFPHMGNLTIAVKGLLKLMGLEVIPPAPPSKHLLNLGLRFSPEFACLPFKRLLGGYIDALNKGADTILVSGGSGPCRAGYFACVHERILKDLGYKFKLVVLEPSLSEVREGIKELLGVKRFPWRKFWRAMRISWCKLKALEEMERLSHSIRPYEQSRGDSDRIYQEGNIMIDQAMSRAQVKGAEEITISRFKNIPKREGFHPIKIGIVGEIYDVLEPRANMEMEKKLTEMGAVVKRSIWISEWCKINLFLRNPFKIDREKDLKWLARDYLEEPVGGEGLNSVGHTIIFAREGYDGVIHIAPFGCLPEIVAESILIKVSEDYNIPILTFNFDEHSSETGIRTRLEAFVDMLKRQRDKKGRESRCMVT